MKTQVQAKPESETTPALWTDLSPKAEEAITGGYYYSRFWDYYYSNGDSSRQHSHYYRRNYYHGYEG